VPGKAALAAIKPTKVLSSATKEAGMFGDGEEEGMKGITK
jgi:hypothetical protein